VIVTFWVSMTVGTMSLVVFWVTVNEVAVVPLTAKLMDFTRQVVKGKGTLFAPAMLAKIWLKPGTAAVACAWLSGSPMAVLLTVTTCAFSGCQLNCPTLEVMSAP
jgi:hypothetical protein